MRTFPVFLVVAFLIQTAFCAVAHADDVLLDVDLPITAKSAHAAIETIERLPTETSTVFLQLNVRADEELYGRGSSFGACYDLASLLTRERFASIRFVAFMPQSIQGHSVLVALACQERIMTGNSEIGPAGIDEEKITPTHRQSYLEIAKRRNIPAALAEKLLDPQIALLQVETEQGLRLITPQGVDTLKQTETLAEEPTSLIPAGQQGIFSARTAREIRLIDAIAEDRIAAARALDVMPDNLKVIPITNAKGHAVRVDVHGVISTDRIGAAMRSIQKHIESPENDVDFLCLYIDSPGGDLDASLTLASFLVSEIHSERVRTVAYIPRQARSDAALIAVACDEIVLGPAAVLGGDGARNFSADQIADARRMIRESIAKKALRSWSMPVAFVDPSIEIFAAVKETDGMRKPLTYHICEEELDEFPDKALWQKEEIVKPQGELLHIIQGKGESFFIDRTAKDFAEFKLLYGLEDDPMLLDFTWTDQLLRILQGPGVSAVILFVVVMALMFESNSPGIGIGVFVAIIGLVLFFWINFLGGTAGWLEVMLFLVGVGCLLLEIFVLPGFGVMGIGGIVAIIASLVLASQTFTIPQNSYQMLQFRNSLLIFAVSGAGMFVLGTMLSRMIENLSKPNNTEIVQESERLVQYDHLVGLTGFTATPLVPSGKVRIGNNLYDVVSDGDLIEKGQPIKIVQVVGYKIVVKKDRTL